MTEESPAASLVPVPLSARVGLARAAVQVIAGKAGVDLLHIKGDAADPSLRPDRDAGTDVDVLVRPAHVARLHDALRAHDWSVYSRFAYGSPFEHAQTYWHELWGYLDLHRWFPGIRIPPADAFDDLWRSRQQVSFAGIHGAVPEVDAQAVILILNAARDLPRRAPELQRVWFDASPRERARRAQIIDAFDARVAFAAAVGGLDDYRRRREYTLWRVVSRGGTRAEEWWGRVRAQTTLTSAVRTALRAPLPNPDRLTHLLGHAPTRSEIVHATLARPVRAVRDLYRGRRSG